MKWIEFGVGVHVHGAGNSGHHFAGPMYRAAYFASLKMGEGVRYVCRILVRTQHHVGCSFCGEKASDVSRVGSVCMMSDIIA